MDSQSHQDQQMHQLHDQHFHQVRVDHSHRDRVAQMVEVEEWVGAISIQR
jgi:hypothetical protein